jgi:chromosome partitioning protein
MRTYAIVNRKGGVGKTTTAVELAYILATSCGYRVLLIDADSQANATWQTLNQRMEDDGLSALLRGEECYYTNLLYRTDIETLDVMPASRDLGRLDLEYLVGAVKPDFHVLQRLRAAIEEDSGYDFCVIDCPPYYSVSCVNAIGASSGIIIPTNTDNNSVMGVNEVVEELETLREICPDLRILGCLVTDWHRCDIDEDAVAYLHDRCHVPVFDTVIRRSDKVRESSWEMQPLQVGHPFSAAARSYRAFVSELLAKEGVNHE